MKRLPRTIRIGHYTVHVILCAQSVLRDLMDDEDDGLYHGCWLPDLEEGNRIHGRIFILQTLPLADKWDALWHEAHHMITDLSSWDKELRQGDT